MPKYLISFYEPMVVTVEADNADNAKELFLCGEYDDEKPNVDGQIHEDYTIILMEK